MKLTRQQVFWLSMVSLVAGTVWLACGYTEVGMALLAVGGFGGVASRK